MKPMFWNVLIEVRKPEERSAGGIVLQDEIKEKDMLLCPVGKVIAVGPMAFKTKTAGGHDYSVHAQDVVPGTWVLVNRKVGLPIKLRDRETGQDRWLQMVNDYEILTPLTEEEASSVVAYF